MRSLICILALSVASHVHAQQGDFMSAAMQISWAEEEGMETESEVTGIAQGLSLQVDEWFALKGRAYDEGNSGDTEFIDHGNDFFADHGFAWSTMSQGDYHLRMGNAHVSLAYTLIGKGNYSGALDEANNAIAEYWVGTATAIAANPAYGRAQVHLTDATARLDEL